MNTNVKELVLDDYQGALIEKNILVKIYPWIVISFCACFLFYKYILQISPSVMTHELMAAFNVSGAGLGNLAATYFYAYLVAQLIVGPLLDRYSPRYLTSMAIFFCALGSTAFAHVHSLYAAEISRALIGAGTAFATVSYMKMSAMWFKQKQMAFVDGLLLTAAMGGALSAEVPMTFLVHEIGWRASLLSCGIFGAFFALLFLFLVRDNKKQGLSSIMKNDVSVSDFKRLLKDKKNWLLAFYSGLAFTPIAVLGGLWGNPFFEIAHHLTAIEAAYYSSFIFIGLAIGGPLFGFFADRVTDTYKIMIVGTAIGLVSLTLAIYWASLPLWALASLLFLFGLGTGVFMLCFPLGKKLNHIKLAATVVALINTGDALFGSFTEPLIGKILDLNWDGTLVNHVHYFSLQSYHKAFIILPIYLLLAIVCLFQLRKISMR